MTAILVPIKNFVKEDFMCKCGCGRFNMDENFLIRYQAFRLIHGKPLTPTSGGRCITWNKHEGGVKTSLHQCETKKATATDTTGDCAKIYKDACACGLFNEVEWHKNDGKNFVHLGWDPNQKGTDFKII